MFGFGVPKLPDDPVKMALLTTGLSMLASGDPQQTMRALPKVMGAALQARENRKYRKAQMEFEKQKLDIQKQTADLKMQEYKRQQALRENMMRMFGLGGSPQPSAPNLAQQTQPAPGAISGPVKLPGAPALPQPVAPPQAVQQQVPAQTPPVAVPGSVAGGANMQVSQQVEAFRKQNPDVYSRVINAINQAPPEVRLMYANNPNLLFKTLNKATMKAAGLAGGKAHSASNIINMVKTDDNGNIVDRKVLDLSNPDDYARFKMLRDQNYQATKDYLKPADRPGLKALNTELGKAFSKEISDHDKLVEMTNQLDVVSREFAADPKNYTGAGAEGVLALKKMAKGLFGIDVPGTKTSEVMDMIMRKMLLTSTGGLGKNVSDKDREFLTKALPSMSTSPEGIITFTVMMKELANANSERINFINKMLDEGKSMRSAKAAWNAFKNKRRLFDEKSLKQKVEEYKKAIGFKEGGRSMFDQLTSAEHAAENAVGAKINMSGFKWNANEEEAFKKLAAQHGITREQYIMGRRAGKIRINP